MLKYIGNGSLTGIPARDLTDEEVARFGRKRLLDSGLYVEVRESRKKFKETFSKSDFESEEVKDARN